MDGCTGAGKRENDIWSGERKRVQRASERASERMGERVSVEGCNAVALVLLMPLRRWVAACEQAGGLLCHAVVGRKGGRLDVVHIERLVGDGCLLD